MSKMRVESKRFSEIESLHDREARSVGIRKVLVHVTLDDFPGLLFVGGSNRLDRPNLFREPLTGPIRSKAGKKKGVTFGNNKVG